MPRFAYGGQALMEGVLMRGRDAIGVAVRGTRRPDLRRPGAARQRPPPQPLRARAVLPGRRRALRDARHRHPLADALRLARGGRRGRRAWAGAPSRSRSLFTFGFAIGLFVLLPLFAGAGRHRTFLRACSARWARRALAAFVQHLLEALIRVVIFVGYLLLVSRSAEIRRVFQYHGAEHMTIHALEHDHAADPREDPQLPHRPPALRHGVPGRVHHRQHPAVQPPGRPEPARQHRRPRSCSSRSSPRSRYEVLRWGASAARTGRSAGCSCPASGSRRSPPSSPTTR